MRRAWAADVVGHLRRWTRLWIKRVAHANGRSGSEAAGDNRQLPARNGRTRCLHKLRAIHLTHHPIDLPLQPLVLILRLQPNPFVDEVCVKAMVECDAGNRSNRLGTSLKDLE